MKKVKSVLQAFVNKVKSLINKLLGRHNHKKKLSEPACNFFLTSEELSAEDDAIADYNLTHRDGLFNLGWQEEDGPVEEHAPKKAKKSKKKAKKSPKAKKKSKKGKK